jgi:hypothetical protein
VRGFAAFGVDRLRGGCLPPSSSPRAYFWKDEGGGRERALVLFAHPCPESFSAALHGTRGGAPDAAGWEVDDCDLNAEGFNPVLTEAERRGYHEEPANIEPVAVTSNVCAPPMRWSWFSRSGISATPRS